MSQGLSKGLVDNVLPFLRNLVKSTTILVFETQCGDPNTVSEILNSSTDNHIIYLVSVQGRQVVVYGHNLSGSQV